MHEPIEVTIELPFHIYTWNYKDELDDGKTHIGVMADEVEKVCPVAVLTGQDGYKTVNYNLLAIFYPGIRKLIELYPDLTIPEDEVQ